jgi:hypothetical protein
MYIVRCINVRVMKDNKTKARFIELRGLGLPLESIADENRVNKTTLVNWEQDLKEQVDNVRVMELKVLYDRYYLSVHKKVEFFGDVLSRIRGELETRDLSTILTDKLFAIYAHIYREAQRERLCLNTTDVALLERRERQHGPVPKGSKSGTKW